MEFPDEPWITLKSSCCSVNSGNVTKRSTSSLIRKKGGWNFIVHHGQERSRAFQTGLLFQDFSFPSSLFLQSIEHLLLVDQARRLLALGHCQSAQEPLWMGCVTPFAIYFSLDLGIWHLTDSSSWKCNPKLLLSRITADFSHRHSIGFVSTFSESQYHGKFGFIVI